MREREVGKGLGRLGVPVFMYGAAQADGRRLSQLRRQLNYFRGSSHGSPTSDFPAQAYTGVSGISQEFQKLKFILLFHQQSEQMSPQLDLPVCLPRTQARERVYYVWIGRKWEPDREGGEPWER